MITLHKVDIIKISKLKPRHISHPINQITSKMTFRSGTIE